MVNSIIVILDNLTFLAFHSFDWLECLKYYQDYAKDTFITILFQPEVGPLLEVQINSLLTTFPSKFNVK